MARGGEVDPSRRSTFWPCVLNLSKAIIGAGAMALPRAFYEMGWVAGTACLLLVAVLTYWTLTVLIDHSHATGATTYVGLTRHMCGDALALLLQAALLLFCFGFMVVYLVMMRDLLLGTPPDCNGLLCEFLGLEPGGWVDARSVMLAVAGGLVAPFSGFRDMKRLSFMNGVGIAAVALLTGAAALLGALAVAQGRAAPLPAWPQWGLWGDVPAAQWSHLVGVLPVLLACYVPHQSVHPLMPLLSPSTAPGMNRVAAVSLGVAASTFLGISLGTALAFGPALQVNVLNNLFAEGLAPLLGPGWARVATAVVRGSFLASLLGSALLYMYPLRTCLAQLLCSVADAAQAAARGRPAAQPAQQQQQQQQQLDWASSAEAGLQQPLLARPPPQPMAPAPRDAAAFESGYFVVLTYSSLAAATVVAICVPSIWEALSAIGDVATTIEAFVVPGCIATAAACALPPATAAGGGGGSSWQCLEAAKGVGVAALGVLLLINGVLQRS